LVTEWMMSGPSGAASFTQSALAPAASTRFLASGRRRQKMLSSRPEYTPITAHML
jgi:hypothetical protein